MVKQTSNARVHRFHEWVAVHFSGTETAYLSPSLAWQLAEELMRYAADCEAVKFSKSEIGTVILSGEELHCPVCQALFVGLSGNVQGCPTHGIREGV
jgi:hypothetical protein